MESAPLRVAYMGTPDFAVPPLEAILDAGFQVVGVVTAPDRPAGRGLKLNPSPVKTCAAARGLPLLQPEKLRDPQFLADLAAWQADLFVVVAFRMLPEAVWAMPPLGAMNLHASLLPAYRGAAPIHWAVIRGEKETGLTTFRIEKELDTGLIYEQKPVPIPDDWTTGQLHDEMSRQGAALLVSTLESLEKGTARPFPQPAPPDSAFYARKISPEDARISWNHPSEELYHHIRGFSPWPCAWTTFDGQQLKVYFARRAADCNLPPDAGAFRAEDSRWLVSAADGWLELTDVQLQGRKRMPAADLLRGLRLSDGRFSA